MLVLSYSLRNHGQRRFRDFVNVYWLFPLELLQVCGLGIAQGVKTPQNNSGRGYQGLPFNNRPVYRANTGDRKRLSGAFYVN